MCDNKKKACSLRGVDECQHITIKQSGAEKSKGEIRFVEYDKAKCGYPPEKKYDVPITDNQPGGNETAAQSFPVPFYKDIEKNAKDLFNRAYNYGMIKLNIKTNTDTGVEFANCSTLDRESNQVFSYIESKYKINDYGTTISEKWNTDNTLGTELNIQDQLLAGLNLTGEFNFSPVSGDMAGKLIIAFANSLIAINADANYTKDGPIINGGAVLGYNNWLVGCQLGYDINNDKINQNNIVLGFNTGNFILSTNVNLSAGEGGDSKEFSGTIYQKISPRLDMAIQMAWTTDKKTRFGIAARYELEQGSTVLAKINNANQIGLCYQQRLHECVVITLSTLVNAQELKGGEHKLGMGIEFAI